MYNKIQDVPRTSPTPPKEEMQRLKTKARLRNESCAGCVFYQYSIRSKSGFCSKHRHSKRPKNWCRYFVSIVAQRKYDYEKVMKEWEKLNVSQIQ